MARLYANENFPLATVEALRWLGHDVLTTFESGKSGQAFPDDAVLAYATSENHILLTHNRRHFIRLHLENASHGGIITCTVDPDFEALAQRIDDVLANQDNMEGRLLRVNRPPE